MIQTAALVGRILIVYSANMDICLLIQHELSVILTTAVIVLTATTTQKDLPNLYAEVEI